MLVTVLIARPASASPTPAALLTVTGLGGQTALLTVPAGGMDLHYPMFLEQRLPGPDGAVGGVVLQRARDGALVGGVLLQNVPGFDRALDVPLLDVEHTALKAGTYRLTLLGAGRQAVHLTVRGSSRARHLVAHGRAAPITRVVAATSAGLHTWSDALAIKGGDYVVLGAGSGGDLQQADEAQMCLQSQSDPSGGACLPGGGVGTSVGAAGAASWSGELYAPGDLEPGGYLFGGQAVGVGPRSAAGHASVVISVPRA